MVPVQSNLDNVKELRLSISALVNRRVLSNRNERNGKIPL